MDSEILEFIKKYGSSNSTDEVFEALALKVYRYQYERNKFYKKFCEMQGKRPAHVKDWREIPAMPVTGFKELVLTSFPAKKTVKIFRTSGTTRGAEGRGAHFFDTLKLYEAAIVPLFQKFVLRSAPTMDMRFLIASPSDAPDSSLSFMMGVVRQKFSKSAAFYVKNGKPLFRELTQDLKRLRSETLILATAFALKGFLNYLKHEKIRLKLPAGSRIMETGGFKGVSREISKAVLYQECRSRLGVPEENCVSEYGMTELSSQFYAVGPKGLFRGPAWTRTIECDGHLRHFDLANRGSVMAVQTEDRGRVRPQGFGLLGRARTAELRGCSLSYEEFIRR